MKRTFILGLGFIFALFLAGSGIAISYLLGSTTALQELVELHQVEELRLDLRLRAHRVQNDLKVSQTVFAANLDEIVGNVRALEAAAEGCHSCHHEPSLTGKLDHLSALVDDYARRFSYFVTAEGGGERRAQLQLEAAETGEQIQEQIAELLVIALPGLQRRTQKAMAEIDRSRQVLSVTILLTVLGALLVSALLARRISHPIQLLAGAAQEISRGELGIQVQHREVGEFGRLFEAFNQMSLDLKENKRQIETFVAKLTRLSHALPSLHSASTIELLQRSLPDVLKDLIEVEHLGLVWEASPAAEICECLLSCRGVQVETVGRGIPVQKLNEVRLAAPDHTLAVNRDAAIEWPLGDPPFPGPLRNFVLARLESRGETNGVLFAANRVGGDFSDEDARLLAIVSSGVAETLASIRLYDELRDQMDEVRKAQHELVQAEKLNALGTLTGGVAHDFNNILCGILGHAQLLRARMRPGNGDESLTTIEQASNRGAALTRKLLSFSHPSSPDLDDFEVNDRVRQVAELMAKTVDKRIAVALELSEPSPVVRGDRGEIEQIIMNLCVNARDALVDGGRMLVRTEGVTLEESFCTNHMLPTPGPYVRVAVEDNGCGIPEEDVARIFDPFFTTKRVDQGTGLGLSIVYRIVKSHGGTCLVESTVGEGTRFDVFLPAASGTSDVVAGEPATLTGAGRKVLIVDDEEMICSFLDALLTRQGFTTRAAHNGREALDLLAGEADDTDLVILDLNMPVMNGEQVLEQLRSLRPGLPVIAISGVEIGERVRDLLQQCAGASMLKPFGTEEISRKIHDVL